LIVGPLLGLCEEEEEKKKKNTESRVMYGERKHTVFCSPLLLRIAKREKKGI
jgi:hypothetical protein